MSLRYHEILEANHTLLNPFTLEKLMLLSTDTDWNRYESKHWWALDDWMRANLEDPELETLISFAEKSRRDYFHYERPLCDWGVFVLRMID